MIQNDHKGYPFNHGSQAILRIKIEDQTTPVAQRLPAYKENKTQFYKLKTATAIWPILATAIQD